MSALTSCDNKFQAGDLWIDAEQQLVCRNGRPIPLPRLSFDLLLALVRAHPKMLSVEQLMDQVWSPAIVNPETVGQRIKLLRHSLGDDPRTPRYVPGVRGRGYRMVAPVARGAESSAEPPAVPGSQRATSPAAARSPERHDHLPLLLFGGLCGAIFACGLAAPWGQKPTGQDFFGAPTPRSVAVLPFVDISDSGGQDYLADGLTDALINRLTSVPTLEVAAETSSFYFKGKRVALGDIAKTLHVANVLEGSLQTSGTGLRVTAELVQGDSGFVVWSRTFYRPLTDLFKVQDDIAGAVIQAMKLSLIDHYLPAVVRTENIEAYTLYLQAISNITNNATDDYPVAMDQLHAALALDPQFADAWASLSSALVYRGNVHGAPDIATCSEARASAGQALRLNPRLDEGHRAAALILQYCDGNFPEAEAEFNRAIALAPQRADAMRSYAWLLVDAGRSYDALRLARQAVDRDPLNSWNYAVLGDAYWRSGNLEMAQAAYQKAVLLNPTTTSLHALYANLLLSAHKPLAAVDEAEREPDVQYRLLTLPLALDAAQRKGEADAAIAAYAAAHGDDDPGEIAVFYACRQDASRAISWLRRFQAKHLGEFASLPNRVACFDNIATDSRYVQLQSEMQQENPQRPLTARARSFRHVDFGSKERLIQAGFGH